LCIGWWIKNSDNTITRYSSTVCVGGGGNKTEIKFWNLGNTDNLSSRVSCVLLGKILHRHVGYIRGGGCNLDKGVISRESIKFDFSRL
jgi:hypothetical protein